MIYLIADTHFNHKNVIEYCNRPFKDVEEMNEIMIKNWNEVVGEDDIVFHLGDFCFSEYIEGLSYKDRYIKTANELLDKLNGRKYLIRGNHDPRWGVIDKCHWEDAYREFIISDEYVLTHRPIDTDLINIHGHVHDKMPFNYDDSFNVSVDVIGFRPIPFSLVEEFVRQ